MLEGQPWNRTQHQRYKPDTCLSQARLQPSGSGRSGKGIRVGHVVGRRKSWCGTKENIENTRFKFSKELGVGLRKAPNRKPTQVTVRCSSQSKQVKSLVLRNTLKECKESHSEWNFQHKGPETRLPGLLPGAKHGEIHTSSPPGIHCGDTQSPR